MQCARYVVNVPVCVSLRGSAEPCPPATLVLVYVLARIFLLPQLSTVAVKA